MVRVYTYISSIIIAFLRKKSTKKLNDNKITIMPVGIESQQADIAGADMVTPATPAVSMPAQSDTSFGSQLGGSIINGITGGVGGAVGNVIGGLSNYISGNTYADQAQHQLDQQRALNQVNEDYQGWLGQQQLNNQIALWKATSYPAQIAEMQQAGLNPALIYGGGGAGGATVGSGIPSGGGGQASDVASMENASTNQSQQLETAKLMELQAEKTGKEVGKVGAEKENIEADTAVKKEQVNAIGAGIDKTKAETALTEVQTKLDNWKLNFNTLTQDDLVSQIHEQSLQAHQELEKAIVDATVAKSTEDQRIMLVYKMVTAQTLNNYLTNQNINLTQTQIWKLGQDVAQRAQEISLKGKGLDQQMQMLNIEMEQAMKRLGVQIGGNTLNTVTGALLRGVPSTTNYNETTVKGDQYNTKTTMTN